MIRYELNSEPNQYLEIPVDGHRYSLTLRTFNGMLFADIAVDGTDVAKSVRCVPYGFIVPEFAMVEGNFLFSAKEDSYPSWEDFDTTCFLYYFTAEEYAKTVLHFED